MGTTTNEKRTETPSSSRVVIRGKLTKDADVKFTSSGTSITKFAVGGGSDGWTEVAPGEWSDNSRAQRCIIWDCPDPLIKQLITGAEVEVTGRIKFEDYTGKMDGKEHTSSEVTAWSIKILKPAPATPAAPARPGLARDLGGNHDDDDFGPDPGF